MRSSQLSYTPETWGQYTDSRAECQRAGRGPQRPKAAHNGLRWVYCAVPETRSILSSMPKSRDAYAAICPVGLEKVLAQELSRMSLPAESRNPGRIGFRAEPRGVAAALCSLRTADRVLAAPGSFHAPDFDSLFEGMRALPWERWIGRDDRVTIVRVRSRASALGAQTSVQAVAHKAVYERLGRVYKVSRMAQTGPEREVRLYLDDDLCTPLLDLSGEPLYKRGWRTESVEAPLRETVAAGLLFLAGWTRKRPLRDPFCGGGTIAVEAALWARDEAPNLRRRFAWETMPSFDAAALREVRADLEARIRRDIRADILGSDRDDKAVAIARDNARRAGVGDLVRFERLDMKDSASGGLTEGLVLTNPPYGLRMGTEAEAEALWREAGGLRDRYPGWSFGFIANREDFPKLFGTRSASSRTILAGAEKLWFHWFPAESGSGKE